MGLANFSKICCVRDRPIVHQPNPISPSQFPSITKLVIMIIIFFLESQNKVLYFLLGSSCLSHFRVVELLVSVVSVVV